MASSSIYAQPAEAQTICQYATSANATEEVANKLASWTSGSPNCDDNCVNWEQDCAWCKIAWDNTASIELTYTTPVYATNVTVEYDEYETLHTIKLWNISGSNWVTIRNNSLSKDCPHEETFTKTSFLTNKVLITSIANDYACIDAVQLCGIPSYCGDGILDSGEECDDGNNINGDWCSGDCRIETPINIVEICDWQGCTSGAASVSVDDSYPSCRDKLNQHSWKGTYYLMETGSFLQADWDLWNDMYNEGHELGGHTQTHPCYEVDDDTLRDELSSNINDILTNLNIPPEDLTSFAWPCGFNTEHEKEIASEYFVSARGYNINALEEKNPADFMEIKSLNTPHYHGPPLDPPDYFDMADLAEDENKWVNFVFHNECEDDGAIDYLSTKNLWVAPVGIVAKYIKERQNSQIQNLVEIASGIRFKLTTSLNTTLFNQNLTLRLFVNVDDVQAVYVNNIEIPFVKKGYYIMFNVNFDGNDHTRVLIRYYEYCGNAILDPEEECDDGNNNAFDGCASDCTLEECAPSSSSHIEPGAYLAYRTLDIGIDVDGSGSSINPSDIRPGFYAFTGERIIYYVLVRDPHGKEFINLVKWVKGGEDEEGPCEEIPIKNTWLDGAFDGHFYVDEENKNLLISETTNLQWDCQVDKMYKCVLTVESEWYGSEIKVEGYNVLGLLGSTLPENWDFNPPLSVDVDTSDGYPLAFCDVIKDQDVPGITEPNCVREMGDDLTPNNRNCENYIPDNMDEPEKKCDISFSENKIIIENIGPPVTLWTFISSENFYDSSGMAKCPYTNELAANQFEYRATQGTWDSGWRVMPQYAPNMDCSGPTLFDTCRGACRISTGCPFDVLPPLNHIEVALKLVWPTPCIGSFDVGNIVVIVRAI